MGIKQDVKKKKPYNVGLFLLLHANLIKWLCNADICVD